MPNEHRTELGLFLDILGTLERIGAPYMVIGAFAAAVYGSTRATFDIDIVVDLDDRHIEELASAYPPPRYYADVVQMRDAIRQGTMFNIIDADRGEKADLLPLTMVSRYRHAFARRIRQQIELPSGKVMTIWCARAEDVIVGKLMAWAEGRSRKHEMDIYQILVFSYLHPETEPGGMIDEAYVEGQARALGNDVADLWTAIRDAAQREVKRTG